MINDLKEGDSGFAIIESKLDNIPFGDYLYVVDFDNDILVMSEDNSLDRKVGDDLGHISNHFLEKQINENPSAKSWEWILEEDFDEVEFFAPACEAGKIMWGIK